MYRSQRKELVFMEIINLNEVEQFTVSDGTCVTTYRRKKRKSSVMKVEYSYTDPEAHYCPRCGNVKWKVPADYPKVKICDDCAEDVYETIAVSEIPDVVYAFLADDLEVNIKLFSGKTYTFKL